jgi:undecaprenyl-diphosphatase
MKYLDFQKYLKTQFILLSPLFLALILINVITSGEPELFFKPLRVNKNLLFYLAYFCNNYLIQLVYLIYIVIIVKSILNKNFKTLSFAICFVIGQLLFALFFVHLFKRTLGAPRPNSGESQWHFFTNQGRYHSMPSGHTTEITGSAGTLAQFKGGYLKALLWGLLPALIAFSRIYAGMHHSIDILAGAILGSLTALFVLWAHTNPNFGRSWKLKLQNLLSSPHTPDPQK